MFSYLHEEPKVNEQQRRIERTDSTHAQLAPRPMHQTEMWPRTNHGKVAERLRTSRHICYGTHKQPGPFCIVPEGED